MPVNRNTKKVVFSKPSNYNVSVKTTFKSSSDVEILKLKTIDTPKFNFEKKTQQKMPILASEFCALVVQQNCC